MAWIKIANFFFLALFWYKAFNLLSAKLTKWPNTLKKFVGNLPTNCLSVFGQFVRLALKGLSKLFLLWRVYLFKVYFCSNSFFSYDPCGWYEMFSCFFTVVPISVPWPFLFSLVRAFTCFNTFCDKYIIFLNCWSTEEKRRVKKSFAFTSLLSRRFTATGY